MTDACSECGSTDWRVSLVDDRGVRTCLDCLVGRTQLITLRPGERLETGWIKAAAR